MCTTVSHYSQVFFCFLDEGIKKNCLHQKYYYIIKAHVSSLYIRFLSSKEGWITTPHHLCVWVGVCVHVPQQTCGSQGTDCSNEFSPCRVRSLCLVAWAFRNSATSFVCRAESSSPGKQPKPTQVSQYDSPCSLLPLQRTSIADTAFFPACWKASFLRELAKYHAQHGGWDPDSLGHIR